MWIWYLIFIWGHHHQVISFGLVEVDLDFVPAAVLSHLYLHSCISNLTLSGKLRWGIQLPLFWCQSTHESLCSCTWTPDWFCTWWIRTVPWRSTWDLCWGSQRADWILNTKRRKSIICIFPHRPTTYLSWPRPSNCWFSMRESIASWIISLQIQRKLRWGSSRDNWQNQLLQS